MKQVNVIGTVTLVFSVVTNSSCGLLKNINTRRIYARAGCEQGKPHPHKLSSGRRDLLGTLNPHYNYPGMLCHVELGLKGTGCGGIECKKIKILQKVVSHLRSAAVLIIKD